MNYLAKLEMRCPLSEKLAALHKTLRAQFGFLNHISVATYDPSTDRLKTFLDSAATHPALSNYQARLRDVPSLQAVIDSGRPRVIHDLAALHSPAQSHTRRLIAAGYRSSYTLPMFFDGEFFGFVFFNGDRANCFSESVVTQLDPFGRLMALVVVSELRSIRRLTAATRTIRHITSHRDCETGAHLERMARYARLIAQDLAASHGLSDEYIEHVFLFAPMHDIGKIAIADNILLKAGPLDSGEWDEMKSHTVRGLEMIDYMLDEFDLRRMPQVDILRNIVYAHHEQFDGCGYPRGLRGAGIPLEARIVTVADVFDALTSRRPYKDAWRNDAAFAELAKLAGYKLDPQCVGALLAHPDEVEDLQKQFREDVYA